MIDSILQGEPIYIYLSSTENVYLHAELIDQLKPIEDTIYIVDTICEGATYVYYGKDHEELTKVIQQYETWTDTISYIKDNILDADSIMHYEIHLRTIPEPLSATKLPITLFAGRAIDLSAANDSLARYFNLNDADTVAKVDMSTIKWSYLDDEYNIVPINADEKVNFGEEFRYIKYEIEIIDDCGDIKTLANDGLGESLDVDTTYIHRDTLLHKVCPEEVVTIGGKDFTITADTTVVDTFLVVDWDATLKQDVDSIVTHQFLVWKQPELLTQFEQEDMPVAQIGKSVDVEKATVAIKDDIADQQQADSMLVAVLDSVEWQVKNGNEYVALTTDHLTEGESLTLRYGVRTDVCDTIYYSEDIQIAVAPKDSFLLTIQDTVCVGDIYVSHEKPEGTVINDSTTWVERFNYALSAEQDIDSVYTYIIYVYKDYEAVTITPVETQVGKLLTIADADAELKEQLDAQNQADGLKVTYSNITWAVKTNNYEIGDRITSEDPITLEYTVQTNECSASTLTGEVVVNILVVDSVVAPAVLDTLCPGSTFQSRLDEITINSDTTWTERIALADTQDETQWKDSVYVYEVYVYQTPDKQTVSRNIPTASCGKPVDVEAATAELESLFTPADLYAPVDSIYWDINLGNGWNALTNEALDTKTTSFQLRYNARTICGDIIPGDEIEVTVADDCEEQILDIVDTVCAGTKYDTRLMNITITADIQLSDTLMITDENGNKFDSIYNYTIYVYKEIELPEQDAVDAVPQAVCGEELRIDSTIEELQSLFTQDPLTEPVSEITWEIDLGNGYEALTDQVVSASLNTINLRYTVVGLCNTKQGEFTVKVEKPNSVNNPDKYEEQQAVQKYEGWLLMINYNKLSAKAQELGLELTEDLVVWYKVNGEPDITTEDLLDLPDDSVGIGYYYTKQEILPAGDEYYALVKIPVTAEEECGGSMYTNFITIKEGVTPLNLAPNIVKPGDDMYITGLIIDNAYTISVFDLTGNCVERFDVNNADSYTLRAQQAPGYYMVQVSTDAEDALQQTFKYVVK